MDYEYYAATLDTAGFHWIMLDFLRLRLSALLDYSPRWITLLYLLSPLDYTPLPAVTAGLHISGSVRYHVWPINYAYTGYCTSPEYPAILFRTPAVLQLAYTGPCTHQ